MIPCARTRIRQQLLIRKGLFWSDHVAIYAVPYGLTDGRISHLRYFFAFFRHSFLPVEKHVWSSHALDQQNHEGRNWAASTALVRENVALCDQKSADYSNSSSVKQTSNNGFKGTGVMNDAGERGRKSAAFRTDTYDQKRSQFRTPLRANRAHTQSF